MVDGPFRGSAAVVGGLVTPGVLHGPRYRRVFPDVYAPAELPTDLALRSRAAYLWARGRGVLTGYSAAELWGAACAPRDADAEVAIAGAHLRRHPGLRISRAEFATEEVREHLGVRLTTPIRTAYDLARRLGQTDAVVAVDALAYRFGFTVAELAAFAERHPGARDCRRLRSVLPFVNPKAASPMETRLRLLLIGGGLPAPSVQYPVLDEHGRTVALLDLAYPEDQVAIEYEGADHFSDHQVRRDGRRYTRLAHLRWRVYRYFASDVYLHPARILREISEALNGEVGCTD